MALQIEILQRKFVFDKQTLPDPNPDFSAEQVREFYSAQYPELNNASIVGPNIINDSQEFSFKTVLGTKG